MTLPGARGADLGPLAAERGLSVQETGGSTVLSFTVETAEEALERISALATVLAPKG